MKKGIVLETKQDYEQLLRSILEPLKPFYTTAGLWLGDTASCYGRDTVRMEAFLRPLWGLVPYWAGGGEDTELEETYIRGLAAGTEPQDTAYWGGFWHGDQRFVEMAAIAYGLLLTPEKLLDPLNPAEKENLVAWLNGINLYELPVCNWQFFRVLVNVALKRRGLPYDAKRLADSLAMIDSFYLADGWYQDGDSGQRDYYTPFALHFYGLVYAKEMQAEDPERCQIYRERAIAFAKSFIYWFDEDGTALPFGRSQTYRFAQVAFFSACLLADAQPFPLGQMKGLIARHLRHWMQKPIFDRAGLLTIGYGYPNLGMAEKYNAPGSPYWSLKTFAFLALPQDHPFWQAKEEPLPQLDEQKCLAKANMLIRRYPGHTTAYTPGQYGSNNLGHFQEKYGKFAYDTQFGFSVAKSNDSLAENAPDSMLAFLINGQIYTRRHCDSFALSDQSVISSWSPFPGVTVKTELIPTQTGHIRKHTVQSDFPCTAYDCGFAVATDGPGAKEGTQERAAWAQNDVSRCLVSGNGTPIVIGADPNTNLIYPMTKIPAIQFDIHQGRQELTTVIEAYCGDHRKELSNEL